MGSPIPPPTSGSRRATGAPSDFIRTLKKQVIWVKRWSTIDELQATVRSFVVLYNREWLIERHGRRTPQEAYLAAMEAAAA